MVRNTKVRGFTRLFWISVAIGLLASVLVDLDHPLSVVLGVQNQRFAHSYYAVAGSIALFVGCGCIITYLCRLYRFRILRK